MKQHFFLLPITLLLCLVSLLSCTADNRAEQDTASPQTPSAAASAERTEAVTAVSEQETENAVTAVPEQETEIAVTAETTQSSVPDSIPPAEDQIPISRNADHYLQLIQRPSLYSYETEYASSHELNVLVGFGADVLPYLTEAAQTPHDANSGWFNEYNDIKAMLAASIIDPAAIPELIPSAAESYLYYAQERLVFDRIGRRILCCKYLPIAEALQIRFGSISVYPDNIEIAFLSWESDTVIRLGFSVTTAETDIGQITGTVDYDFSANTVLSLEYTTEFEPAACPMPYDDTSRTVCEQLDILMNVPNAYSAQMYIDAHPEAYHAIVSLGDAALPYLQQVIEETPRRLTYRIFMAQTLANAIDPDLYDTVSISPDSTNQIRIQAADFFYVSAETGPLYSGVTLTDAASGTVLAEAPTEWLCYPEISWSPDSRYAVINHGHLKYGGGTPIVIDTVGKTVSAVSGILDAVAAARGLETIELYSIHTATMPWESDTVRISFNIRTHAASNPGFIRGYCYVDGATGGITETVIEEYETPQSLQ